jgi:hypothetical protein
VHLHEQRLRVNGTKANAEDLKAAGRLSSVLTFRTLHPDRFPHVHLRHACGVLGKTGASNDYADKTTYITPARPLDEAVSEIALRYRSSEATLG